MAKKEKLLASAQKYLQKGQVAKAIKDYQKIVQIDPKDVRNRQKLAELLGRDKKVAEALEEYEAVAKHYGNGGFYLKAIAVYKQMQRLAPGHVDLYYRLAELNEKQGLVGNALAEYRNLVAHFEKQENVSEAIDVLQKMRELEPDNLNILVKIAETYAKVGEQEKAREEFDEALGILRQKGDHGRILKLYEVFLPIYPDDLQMKIGLAQVLIERDEADKSIQLLQKLLADHPEDPDILWTLALGYRKAGQPDQERLTCQHLLRQNPDDLDLREAYIRACLNAGEPQRALEELEEWKDAFLDADKVSLLRDFYQELKAALPDAEDVGATLRAIYEITGEEDKLAQVPVSPPGEILATDPGAEDEGEEGVDEPLIEEEVGSGEEPVSGDGIETAADTEQGEAVAEEVEGAEEIPLEFLEDVAPEEAILAESSVTSEEDGSANDIESGEPLTEEPVADEEVELELDITLDDTGQLDLDVDEGPDEEFVPLAPEDDEDFAGDEGQIVELEIVEPLSEEFSEAEGESEPAEGQPEEVVEEVLELEDVVPLEEVVSVVDARAEMEEAEFYLQQGLLEDAERICRSLIEADPQCEEARQKLGEIEVRKQEEAKAEAKAPPEGLFDLAAEIGDDDFPALEEAGIDFADSQKGIETEIDSEDTESHYNLGIAYKEMGLMDDAVAEFDKAMKNPDRAVDCLTLKGLCLADSGSFEEAERAFKGALEHERVSDEERVSINYELGLLLEKASRFSEALECFRYVGDVDLFHREVGEKIETLSKKLGLEEGGGEDQPGGKGSKDRVSYV